MFRTQLDVKGHYHCSTRIGPSHYYYSSGIHRQEIQYLKAAGREFSLTSADLHESAAVFDKMRKIK